MKTSSMTLEKLIQGYFLSCQTEGKSPRTTEWYSRMLARGAT